MPPVETSLADVEGAKKYLYQSQQWHEDCFKCTACTTSIGTNSFIPHDGQPVCVTCYHDNYAIKCDKCNGVSVVLLNLENPQETPAQPQVETTAKITKL